MIRRLGRKTKLLPRLLALFPQQITTFIDLFFGSGVVSYAMVPRVRYVIANDKDAEIANLFFVLKDQKEELLHALTFMPIHEDVWRQWKSRCECDPVWRAVRFLFQSNFGYLGKPASLLFGQRNDKYQALHGLEQAFQGIQDVQFMSCDFREVLPKIQWRKKDYGRSCYPKDTAFLYADPPYCQTAHNYDEGFTEHDTCDLFDLYVNSGIRFAISEFDTSFIRELADSYTLFITPIVERQTLKSRNTEVLITNYDAKKRQQDFFSASHQL